MRHSELSFISVFIFKFHKTVEVKTKSLKKLISTYKISSQKISSRLQPGLTSEIHSRTTKKWLQVLSSQQIHMSGALKKPSSHLLPGYSEDGGAQRGEVIPEHEFAEGPVCLDDENEFPPVGNQSN